jgi:hypothetical protein
MPLGQHVQLVREEPLFASVALNLAAGGLRDAAVLDEDNRVSLQLVLLGHGAADDLHQLAQVGPVVVLDFLDQDQSLFILNLARDGCAAARAQGRVAAFDGQLDVLRVVVKAADDD